MCNCLNTVLEKTEEKLKPSKKILDWKIYWKDQVFRFDGGCGVGLRIAYEYRLLKKDGTPMKNLRKNDIFIAMSFCPFCGESLKEAKDV